MSVELLQNIYFFNTFTPEEMALVTKICERQKYSAGQLIFSQGELAEKMFLVELGTIGIMSGDRQITQIGKGGIFGEMPFLDAGNRSANAKALEESHLIEISYSDLNKVLINHPETALKFYIIAARYVSKRLRSLVEGF